LSPTATTRTAAKQLDRLANHPELRALLTGLFVVPTVQLQAAFHHDRRPLGQELPARFRLPPPDDDGDGVCSGAFTVAAVCALGPDADDADACVPSLAAGACDQEGKQKAVNKADNQANACIFFMKTFRSVLDGLEFLFPQLPWALDLQQKSWIDHQCRSRWHQLAHHQQ
jgi:hypothetical protein